jgi:hypothetical protein
MSTDLDRPYGSASNVHHPKKASHRTLVMFMLALILLVGLSLRHFWTVTEPGSASGQCVSVSAFDVTSLGHSLPNGLAAHCVSPAIVAVLGEAGQRGGYHLTLGKVAPKSFVVTQINGHAVEHDAPVTKQFINWLGQLTQSERPTGVVTPSHNRLLVSFG